MHCLAKRIQDNTSQVLKKQEDIQVKPVGSPVNIAAQSGDRFCRGGIDLLYSAAYEAINFYQLIANAYRGEEYTRDYTRVMKKLIIK